MKFRAVVVLKHPVDQVWRMMRDELDQVIAEGDGLRELLVLRREAQAAGSVRVVSRWQADAAVPTLAAPYVNADMFRWEDDAVWIDEQHLCRWSIKTLHLPDRIACQGVTRYEPAMGGRGTRLSMEGTFQWNLRGFLDLPVPLESAVSRGIESFVGGMIPRNFRNVAEAVRRRLDRDAG
jgi:hypothetical protein